MSELNKHITIPKNVASGNELDYAYLKQLGLEYIEKLSGKLWTDYNEHDPGVTILEMLCYAITDLGARINLPIENILASNKSNKIEERQFFKASEILPTKPVTENDYRKLFVDIDGVKNCWLLPFDKRVFVDKKNSILSYKEQDLKSIAVEDKTEFSLNGLYKLIVDFDELSDSDFPKVSDKKAELERIKGEILSCYHANRNLCEDLIEVNEVEQHTIEICASIEVYPESDEELVHAMVLSAIDKYFSPGIRFYSLNEMLKKGYKTDEIFDGPNLQHGFIDNNELKNATLRTEVRLSDLMKLVTDVEGVKALKDMSIRDPKAEKERLNPWQICVEDGKKPIRHPLSAFSYYKGVLPLNVNHNRVKTYYQDIKNREKEEQELASVGMELEIPQAQYLQTGETTSVQNDFPETYGIGESGLSAQASVKRRIQAKQLKAYLLFFDQILATYFAHLEKAKNVLSVDNQLSATYFTQVVKDISGFEDLVNDYPFEDDELSEKLFGDFDDKLQRKNQLLDHLLARFSEKMSAYSFLMKQLYGTYADNKSLETKEVFLSEYGELKNKDGSIKNKGLSNWRGSAYNYYKQKHEAIWNTENVAGAQKRIARLCGLKDFSRRNLSFSFIEIYDLINSDGKKVYRWRIKDINDAYLLSASDDYVSPRLAEDELYQTIVKILETSPKTIQQGFEQEVKDETEIGNFEVQQSEAGKFSFDIINRNAAPNSIERIIARQFSYYNSSEELKNAMLYIISFFTSKFVEEGMFIVEHILLRPNVQSAHGLSQQFMPVCTNDEKNCQLIDPYSYRVTVVLPGWTHRFRNMDFRNFMEDLIRRELPAHVLARICWIGERSGVVPDDKNEMMQFENAYRKFLEKKTDLEQEQDEESLVDFIEVLSKLTTIYPPGRLVDCQEEDEYLEGKIVLGRTNIGNF